MSFRTEARAIRRWFKKAGIRISWNTACKLTRLSDCLAKFVIEGRLSDFCLDNAFFIMSMLSQNPDVLVNEFQNEAIYGYSKILSVKGKDKKVALDTKKQVIALPGFTPPFDGNCDKITRYLRSH